MLRRNQKRSTRGRLRGKMTGTDTRRCTGPGVTTPASVRLAARGGRVERNGPVPMMLLCTIPRGLGSGR